MIGTRFYQVLKTYYWLKKNANKSQSNLIYLFLFFYRYSVLPYWNQEHDDALALLEREMARAQAAGEDLGLTDDEEQALGDDRPQENENDSDNISLDYMEGAEVPDKMKPLIRSNKAGEEVIPSNVVYSQPHSIQKLPNELGPGQIDNFERPYMRGTKNVNKPMQQNTYATGKVIDHFNSKIFYY